MRSDRKKRNDIVECEICGTLWQLEPGDVILEPWPRFRCPKCGHWIPLY